MRIAPISFLTRIPDESQWGSGAPGRKNLGQRTFGTRRRLRSASISRAALVSGLVDVITDNPEAELETLRAGLARLDDLRVVRQLIAEAAHTSYDEAVGAHLAACERYLRRREVD